MINDKSGKDIKQICEKARHYLQACTIIHRIFNFFRDNKDLALNIKEIFDIVITPFYTIADSRLEQNFLSIIKIICEFWVRKGKLTRTIINDEIFYFDGSNRNIRATSTNKKI